MTFCYTDETSTETARTAAVFRHMLAWILHVCLISLQRFPLTIPLLPPVFPAPHHLTVGLHALTVFKRTLEIGVRVYQTFAQGSHGERQIPRPLAVPSGNESLFFSMIVL